MPQFPLGFAYQKPVIPVFVRHGREFWLWFSIRKTPRASELGRGRRFFAPVLFSSARSVGLRAELRFGRSVEFRPACGVPRSKSGGFRGVSSVFRRPRGRSGFERRFRLGGQSSFAQLAALPSYIARMRRTDSDLSGFPSLTMTATPSTAIFAVCRSSAS